MLAPLLSLLLAASPGPPRLLVVDLEVRGARERRRHRGLAPRCGPDFDQPDEPAVVTTLVDDIGTFGFWVAIAVDVNDVAWIRFNRPNAESTSVDTWLVAAADDGTVTREPSLLVEG